MPKAGPGSPSGGESATEISVIGAREHNLRDVTLKLPKHKLICFTGVSGSGKSSLAFDTLYAEGQRRYIESLSSYARQFMGELPKPDVDQVSGLAPAIAIQQKSTGWNPRSTVGTITQIQDYLRVLFARAGTQRCPNCSRAIEAQTREQMIARVLSLPEGTAFLLLAPVIRGQKGEHRDLLHELQQRGFARARIDGELYELQDPPELDRYRKHTIEVVVDRLVIKEGLRPRLAESLETALSEGSDLALISVAEKSRDDVSKKDAEFLLSAGYACANCDLGFEPPHPQLFSFNSPSGMCTSCDGLGERFDFDPELLIPDPKKSFLAPCVAAFRGKFGRWKRHIYDGVAQHLGIDLKKPWQSLPESARHALLYGTGDAHITYHWKSRKGGFKHGGTYDGVIAELSDKYRKSNSRIVRTWFENYMRRQRCPNCAGARLNDQARAVTLNGTNDERQACDLNIHDVSSLSIDRVADFLETLSLSGPQRIIATEPLKEIMTRLRFLLDVGLDYLTLDRPAPTLSGGESQRIRLASQIGSGLVGVLYVLDEPSIGLHPRDNRKLIEALLRLRDAGNTVIVVEHDRETMEAADLIIDFGPGPGVRGGHVVAQGDLDALCTSDESVTGAFLSGREEIAVPQKRRPITRPQSL